MSKLMTNLLGLMIKPTRTIRTLLLSNPAKLGWFVFIVFLASVFLRKFVMALDIWITRIPSFLVTLPLEAALWMFSLLLFTAILHLTADLLGGAGRGASLFFLLMSSTLPLCLIGPSSLLITALLQQPKIDFIITSILALWSICLVFLSIRELYRLSFQKSVAILILPFLMFALILGLVWINIPGFSDKIASEFAFFADSSKDCKVST
jgi:hypothetical protein